MHKIIYNAELNQYELGERSAAAGSVPYFLAYDFARKHMRFDKRAWDAAELVLLKGVDFEDLNYWVVQVRSSTNNAYWHAVSKTTQQGLSQSTYETTVCTCPWFSYGKDHYDEYGQRHILCKHTLAAQFYHQMMTEADGLARAIGRMIHNPPNQQRGTRPVMTNSKAAIHSNAADQQKHERIREKAAERLPLPMLEPSQGETP